MEGKLLTIKQILWRERPKLGGSATDVIEWRQPEGTTIDQLRLGGIPLPIDGSGPR
jgi:hypothetical protein